MLVTGAGFDRMEIYQDTSGFAYSWSNPGGVGMAIIASAGYVGTAVFGAFMLVVGRTRRGAKTALAIIGAVLLLTSAVWVRNQFGLITVLSGGAAFLAVAVLANEKVASFLLNFVAAQACINAVLDIRVLFRSNLVVNGEVMQRSDAHNMADATFGTAWMWAAVWMAWSFALFYVALRRNHLSTVAARTSSRSPQGSAST
jgi:hypothetical protein